MSKSQNTSYIVLAAGKGTRMNSALPKVLHQLCGRSLLERTLRAILPLKPLEVVVVIGDGADRVAQELDRISQIPEFNSIEIKTALQENQNGTGHAAQIGFAKCSQEANRVAILPGDIPLIDSDQLELLFSDSNSSDLCVLTCEHPDPKGFGRIVRDANGSVLSVVEEKDADKQQRSISEINSSIYLACASLLKEFLSKLDTNNAQGEYYLTDIVSLAVENAKSVVANCTKDYLSLSGANTRLELSRLEAHRRQEIANQFQLAGVSFEDSSRAYIDEGVVIGVDSFIGANTRISGDTTIGSNVVIEGDSLIRQSSIGDNCLLRLGCYISDAEIKNDCSLGPFVQVRPGACLEQNVKLGNFVEVKNAKLGEGAKANHLAYIGDATVGAESNIGAGTIFCNYDGVSKHHSTLGEKVFIGSNSVLVSPVELGDNAYVAAGSTITREVPAGALGVARSRQSNIDGWVAKKRKTTDKK